MILPPMVVVLWLNYEKVCLDGALGIQEDFFSIVTIYYRRAVIILNAAHDHN